MEDNLNGLSIERIIIHSVAKHRSVSFVKPAPPAYSEIESPLTDDLRMFFKEKIVQAIGSQRVFQINFQNSPKSFARYIFSQVLSNTKLFIASSKKVADKLNEVQTARNPGGLVAVIECKMEEEYGLCILKLERDEGVRIEKTTVDGQTTFNLHHVKELILSQKTRLYKLALFWEHEKERRGFDGYLCDYQYNPADRNAADFFLKALLECELSADPKVMTKTFFEAVGEFINTQISDAETKSRYNLHLLSYLRQNEQVVSPEQFTNQSIDVPDQASLLSHLARRGISKNAFERDTTPIQNKIAHQTLEFQDDIVLIAKPEAFDNKIQLQNLEGGKTRTSFESILKSIH